MSHREADGSLRRLCLCLVLALSGLVAGCEANGASDQDASAAASIGVEEEPDAPVTTEPAADDEGAASANDEGDAAGSVAVGAGAADSETADDAEVTDSGAVIRVDDRETSSSSQISSGSELTGPQCEVGSTAQRMATESASGAGLLTSEESAADVKAAFESAIGPADDVSAVVRELFVFPTVSLTLPEARIDEISTSHGGFSNSRKIVNMVTMSVAGEATQLRQSLELELMEAGHVVLPVPEEDADDPYPDLKIPLGTSGYFEDEHLVIKVDSARNPVPGDESELSQVQMTYRWSELCSGLPMDGSWRDSPVVPDGLRPERLSLEVTAARDDDGNPSGTEGRTRIRSLHVELQRDDLALEVDRLVTASGLTIESTETRSFRLVPPEDSPFDLTYTSVAPSELNAIFIIEQRWESELN